MNFPQRPTALRMTRLTVLVVMCLISLPLALAAEGKPTPALWLAEKDGKTVHLFGSIHAGNDSMYPLPDEVMQAFRSSEAAAFELDMSNPLAMAAPMLAASQYQDGKTDVSSALDHETLDLLKAELTKQNLLYDAMKGFKPWFLAMQLTMVHLQKQGYSELKGIDLHLTNKAKKAKKPIIGLETIQQQLKVLEGLDQNVFVRMTLKPLQGDGKEILKMFDIWKSGDVKALEKMAIEDALKSDPGMEKVYDSFLYGRNGVMAKRIDEEMTKRKTLFVVVGAAHLVGKKSVQDLMSKNGWQIKDVPTTPAK